MTTPRTEHRAKIAEARNVLGEVIARARFAGEPTILMNRGKEAAVLVSYAFYEQAKRDRQAAEAIARALGDLTDEQRGAVAKSLYDRLLELIHEEGAGAES
ncbi:type II toxin-antitoxin system prevent-host-death family antitoxin [Streptomyces aidingensis]|uniref:Antitoxin n=1 Tax=Streptomyces aidingensis TaxID=910347 RepID=A0A1I1PTP3_9ACTN|nr:type II toxin-antitoxin system prevent-host-death family antitoxin [Streptomyces aidingensis]SFD13304.1 prevent-host-death family protein [Streptomyces aidingensis]